ncbi:MAG: hypothetical protein ACI8Q2_000023 [Candidatus Omnitrophota bacterium]|jgi:hypothetical protein
MENEKKIAESWKDSAKDEKDVLVGQDAESDSEQAAMEVSFTNYISSLGFQAMIFLGEMPNPMTGDTDKNLNQAKFLIDTLDLLKEKTKGNLDASEEGLLNASVYELQMKYVDVLNKKPETE